MGYNLKFVVKIKKIHKSNVNVNDCDDENEKVKVSTNLIWIRYSNSKYCQSIFAVIVQLQAV